MTSLLRPANQALHAPTPYRRQAIVDSITTVLDTAGVVVPAVMVQLGEVGDDPAGPCRFLEAYEPTVGDVVELLLVGGDPIILGRLARQTWAPVEHFQSANDTTTSTSYVGGTTHGVSFVAPPSGIVVVSFGGHIGSNSVVVSFAVPASRLSDRLLEGDVVGSGSTFWGADDDRSIPFFTPTATAGFKYGFGSLTHLFGGLTPGEPYNATTVFKDVTTAANAAVNDRWIVVDPK